MNLTEWAQAQGIHVTTAYRWYREGNLPVPAQKVGRLILVSPDAASDGAAAGGVGLYARVSSHDQKGDLEQLRALPVKVGQRFFPRNRSSEPYQQFVDFIVGRYPQDLDRKRLGAGRAPGTQGLTTPVASALSPLEARRRPCAPWLRTRQRQRAARRRCEERLSSHPAV